MSDRERTHEVRVLQAHATILLADLAELAGHRSDAVVTGECDERGRVQGLTVTVVGPLAGELSAWLRQRCRGKLEEIRAARQVSAPVEPASSTDQAADLVARAVRNARPRDGSAYRWAAVRDTFGIGSGRARELCRQLGFDPNELM